MIYVNRVQADPSIVSMTYKDHWLAAARVIRISAPNAALTDNVLNVRVPCGSHCPRRLFGRLYLVWFTLGHQWFGELWLG